LPNDSALGYASALSRLMTGSALSASTSTPSIVSTDVSIDTK